MKRQRLRLRTSASIVAFTLTTALLPIQGAVGATSIAESEGPAQRGLNDTTGTADFLASFGTGAGKDGEFDVAGAIPGTVISVPNETSTSLDGTPSTATNTGLTAGNAVFAIGTLGETDHPHGNAGTGTGDFDWFRIAGVTTGQRIAVDVTTLRASDANLDPVVAIYDSAGTRVAVDDDGSERGEDSALTYTAPANGTYYVVVRGFGSGWQTDVNNAASGQGSGANSQGLYTLSVALDTVVDRDVFRLSLTAGDVVGAALSGANLITVRDPDGDILIDSLFSTAASRPDSSPLPAGAFSDLAFVAPATGTYHVQVRVGAGPYELQVRAFRPYLSSRPGGATQTIFLDFDGAAVDTSELGSTEGAQPRQLSPLASFLGSWGLGAASESAVVDAIVATVRENLQTDLRGGPNGDADASGVPGEFDVVFRNSRDHADPFGDPYVTRIVIGGTIAEAGMPAIVATESSGDVGNFAPAETGVVLLDLLSAPASNPNSLNSIVLAGGATMVDLVGVGVGNLASQAAATLLGAQSTEASSPIVALTDRPAPLPTTVGVGPDSTFGTGDDLDVDLVDDVYWLEGDYHGTQPAVATVAFGLSTGRRTLDARFSVSDGSPQVHEVVTFDGSSSVVDPPSGAVTYRWTFGDGSAAVTGRTVTHVFDQTGERTVRLTLTDPSTGAKDSAERVVTVGADSATVDRAAGGDRIATAVESSRQAWASSAVALLATGYNFPDALAAGALAAQLDAPLLLTKQEELSPEVETELARLGVETVTILGGPVAVSDAVEARLLDLGYEVDRVEGEDRFQTAATIATRVGPLPAGAVTVALGQHADPGRDSWPDALSAGALSASPVRLPTLLTRSDSVPPATLDALRALAPQTILLLGGPAAISPEVQQQLETVGYTVRRLEGASRYGTSVAVATEALEHAVPGPVPLVLATGANYPDGLTAGAVAARVRGLVLLVPRDDLAQAEEVRTFLQENAHLFDTAIIVGGDAAVSPEVQAAVGAAIAAS